MSHKPYRALALVGLTACALLWGGCPEKDTIFQLRFMVVAPPQPDKTPVCGDIISSSTPLTENEYTLRITFYERPREETEGGTVERTVSPTSLRSLDRICDRVIAPQEDSELVIPVGDRGRDDPIAIQVEAFKEGQLIYSGRRDEISLTQGAGTVYLRQTILHDPTSTTRGMTCMNNMRVHRAFHSATLLPNGQVLIIGGVVAGAGGLYSLDTSGEVAHATDSVELYDPKTLKFLKPQGSLRTPRAFHVAQLLPSPPQGPYEILLVGGVQTDDVKQPAFRLKVNNINLPFLISPHEQAKPAPTALVTYTPSPEPVIEYEELQNMPLLMFPAATLTSPPDHLVVVGGAEAAKNLSVDAVTDPTRGFAGGQEATWIQLKDKAARQNQPPVKEEPIAMGNTRVGHAAARLGAGRLLVFGGNMNGTLDQVAEQHTSGFDNFAAAQFDAAPETSVWHTLTPIGSTDRELHQTPSPVLPTAALLSGGFALAEESQNLRLAETNPRQDALTLIRDGNPLKVEALPAGGFQPVGYHSAVRLYDGSVLLSGGNLGPNKPDPEPKLCDPGTSFCASKQVAAYYLDGTVPTLRDGMPQLQVARFGHRSTRLLDNTILITGGVTVVMKEKVVNGQSVISPDPQLTNVVERLNLRTGDVSEDFPVSRTPPKDNDPDANSDKTTTCRLRSEVLAEQD